MTTFQLVGLAPGTFAPLFDLPDAELAKRGVQRYVADGKPGFPCRVSLADADVGDELLLLAHEHQGAHSPYRASGPIFVRKGVGQRVLEPGELTDYVTTRLMSVRAYDASDLIVEAEVCEGREVRSQIEKFFENTSVRYIHLHNARRGCYSCLVRRV